MSSIYNLIKDSKRISIIGMEKNVGKTTLLNKIIDEVGYKKIIGITSIGRDGEEVDVVTDTKKPRIYINQGTIIATARECLRNCDITKEILLVTNFNTPMGDVIIMRARSSGYVDIAGPSYNKQLKYIVEKMQSFGCDLTIVDGALSRKSTAIGDISDATILSTGASLSLDISKVIDETKKTIKLLTLPEVGYEIKDLALKSIGSSRVTLIYKNNEIVNLSSDNSIDNISEIKKYLNKNLTNIVIRGAITDRFVENLIRNRENYESINLIALDGTRFFIDNILYQKAILSGIELKVLNSINLLFLTCNPWSPRGFEFPREEFKNVLSKEINIPVIDIVGDYDEIY